MFETLLILIFIRPFISSLAFPYLNSIYSALLLTLLIIWFIFKGVSPSKIVPLKYPLILFSLALIISVVFSINPLNSLAELYKYINGILLLLIGVSLSDGNKIRLIRTIALAGLVISLLAIYQYFFGFQHVLNYISKEKITNPFALEYLTQKRVFFPFVTPNTLAGYLAMIIPLALICKNRIVCLIPLCSALLSTKSLGASISLLVALSLYGYLEGKIEKRRIILLIGLIITIGLVFIARVTVTKGHLHPLFSTLMRLNYWKNTLKIIQNHPIIGVGLGNFNLMQTRYAHNSYLQIWVEMGILGIISILWLIATVLKPVFKNIKDSPNKNQLIALLAAVAVFLIHNLVDFSFYLPEISFIWWIILGL